MAIQQEKNILVDRGRPMDPSPGPGDGYTGVPSGYGLGSRGGGNQDFDNSDSIATMLRAQWAEEDKVAAREQEAARVIASEIVRQDAEAAARQAAQRQAEDTARQLAQRQAEDAARQLAQRQAEDAARQLAQRQAEDAAHQLAQRQAEEATRQLTQQLVKEALAAVERADAEKQEKNAEAYIKHAADAGRFWSVVTAPTSPTKLPPIATGMARQFFIRKVAELLGTRLPVISAFFPSALGSSELPASIFTTPASELGIPVDVDLGYIADKKGTIDVTHRLIIDKDKTDGSAQWAQTDELQVGRKVRVRSAIYSPATNTYNFTRDGDSKPSLTNLAAQYIPGRTRH
jgi:hypothetical protein